MGNIQFKYDKYSTAARSIKKISWIALAHTKRNSQNASPFSAKTLEQAGGKSLQCVDGNFEAVAFSHRRPDSTFAVPCSPAQQQSEQYIAVV